ncbi:TIM barrel protein [Rhizobium sp. RM]|uniref:sugar phosphate isomerase/epimerase family protein n=1 Tax=Rhizobium sp. RM TaxID=2748079 RepID=UPI00110EBB52|nr:TIM barrel protein [Rhizobium sp. RM]NWJ25545.1 TIM barrel protein [Rhizobium sp. RM]TMV22144.1 TIM barrel protein [Rhizobium sp. Td3]
MKTFDYSFSTLGCSELNLHEVADLARHHGIACVELRTLAGTVDLIAALEAEFGSPDRFATFLTGRNLKVAALNTSVRLFESEDLSAVEPFIPWAEAAGIAHLRIFDGGGQLSADDMSHAEKLLSDWQAMRQSRQLSVDLMIETHDALADSRQLFAFVERVPTAQILWDTHHTWAKGSDLATVWQNIAKSVVHLHVKDSRLDDAGRRRYVLPGHGNFPMADLISLLRSSDRQIPISLEWERHWHPELPPLDDALTAARSWWR